jgi:hypothetical protein
MRNRAAGVILGLAFGVTLSWSGMTAPDVIRGALLLQHSYLFLFFASAVVVATIGSWALRRLGANAMLTGQPIGWKTEAPARRHILGSLLFGLGWGISDACPGPIATQVGQGIALGAVAIGRRDHRRDPVLRLRQPETEPANDAISHLARAVI